jgi:hypothetical protein
MSGGQFLCYHLSPSPLSLVRWLQEARTEELNIVMFGVAYFFYLPVIGYKGKVKNLNLQNIYTFLTFI